MRILLLFLFIFKVHSACEPGAVPCEEAGISNYKVQTVDPTFTASPNEKGLFNTNSQFKTKDEFGNIQRLVRDSRNLLSIGNGDMEEGLTGYAGIGTLNTTTPLAGLKSINLDTTALNDFMETALVTLPPILFGNTCMARINIRGGDANLQFQVVNGAGTVIASGQFASPFTDSTPQHLVFACPTQADVTGNALLGQVKIKIVQSTATNAALATLDNFYLGELDAQTMAVTEGVEELRLSGPAGQVVSGAQRFWFNTTAKNTISNCANIVLGTSINAGFSYTGKSSCLVNFYLSSLTDIADGTAEIYAYLNGVALSGISRNQNAGSTRQMTSNSSGSLTINAGDILTFGSGGVSAQQPFLILTATPLSQIATVVPTTQTRAGFWGSKKWVNTAGCNWSTASAGTWVDFSAIAACDDNPRVHSGFSIPDAALDGQAPAITFSQMKKGVYDICFRSIASSNNGNFSTFRFSDDLGNISSAVSGGNNSGSNSGFCAKMIYTSDQVNRKIRVQGQTTGGNIFSYISGLGAEAEVVAYYQPDLSDSTEGILVNKMLPIVQGTETVSQWYSYTAASTYGGDFTFPAPLSQKNPNTLFTTTANKVTALKSIDITISANMGCVCNGGGSPGLQLFCTFSGVERSMTGQMFSLTNGASLNVGTSLPIQLNAGDSCRINAINANCLAANNSQQVNITATSFGKPGVITSDAVVSSKSGSTARKWDIEGCLVLNGGTASFGSPSCSNWIQSVTRTAAGQVTVNFIPNIWSSAPQCNMNADRTAYFGAFPTTASTVVFTATVAPTPTLTDGNFTISCGGTQ